MFAKVFSQIFDSTIAEDYNCRRMFMDLLVLADPTGAVDMTHESIARRTNVPIEEVRKYIDQLCQPDKTSRSQLEGGKRLVPLDKNREWGWLIVSYQHYRKLKDEEARRSYFRTAQRIYRAKKKKNTEEEVEEEVKGCSILLSDVKLLSKTVLPRFEEWMLVRRGMGKAPKDWGKMFREQIKWLSKYSESIQIEILSASIRNNWQGLFEPKNNGQRGARPDEVKKPDPSKIDVPERFKSWVSEHYPDKREDAMKWRTWADVPRNGLRDEWWKEEKSKLPIEL